MLAGSSTRNKVVGLDCLAAVDFKGFQLFIVDYKAGVLRVRVSTALLLTVDRPPGYVVCQLPTHLIFRLFVFCRREILALEKVAGYGVIWHETINLRHSGHCALRVSYPSALLSSECSRGDREQRRRTELRLPHRTMSGRCPDHYQRKSQGFSAQLCDDAQSPLR